jgi:hypothetical protein
MRSFEAVFGIAADHRLELVKSRIRGGLIRAEYWRHEEFDVRGVLVAEYESYSELNPASGAVNSGWRRYDPDGSLMESHDELPEPFSDLLAPAA